MRTSAHLASLEHFAVPLGGTLLVEASAGTGKTHTITTLVLRLVLEEGLEIREILVVTFTEAATTELRDRIRRRLRNAVAALGGMKVDDAELIALVERSPQRPELLSRALRALRDLDLASISTIHSFCQSVLRENAFESGARYGLELMPDTTHLVRDVADDYWARRIYRLGRAEFDLATSDFSLKTARTLVSVFARRPHDMPILPVEAGAISDFGARTAWRAARDAWHANGRDVREMISGWQGLHAATYRREKTAAHCDELDEWFREEALGPGAPFDAFAYFSPGQLESRTNRGKATPSHPVFELLEGLHEELRTLQSNLARWLRRGAVEWAREELPRRKSALRVQGFEDLLFDLDTALSGPRADALRARVNARYRAALIDEFQDTDPVQYRIFRSLFHGRGSLLLVGDPKQSIYAFRGADVFAYTNAKSLAGDHAYTLGENRRSDPSLVKAVNTLFARVREPFMLENIGFQPVVPHVSEDRIRLPEGQPALEVLFFPRTNGKPKKLVTAPELPRLIAAEIARFLRSGATIDERPARPGDIAVLTRSNKQARGTQAELRKLLIPTTLQSDENVFASDEALEIELLLRAALEPTRNSFVRSALATVAGGASASDLARLDSDEHAWEQASGRFRAWSEHWTEYGFIHAYRRMLTELGVEGRLLRLVDGERRVTNLLHIGELLHGVEARERLGPMALVRWLGIARAEAERDDVVTTTEAAELRLESDAHAVQLLTIHKSKGLEFPIVYCPFLHDIRLPRKSDDAIDFHDPSDGHALKIDVHPLDGCASLEAKEAETRAESQRLLYVALTRAKHRCTIVCGGIRGADNSALAYALHQAPSALSGAALVRATTERFHALDDHELRADLEALVRASEGTIGVRDLDLEPTVKPWDGEASRVAPTELSARAYTRARVDTWFRVGSFTALAQRDPERAAHVVDPEALARDHDGADETDGRAASAAEGEAACVPLHAFPRGAKAGTMLHEVFEEHDFTSTDPAALRGLVVRKLEAAGYSSEALGDVLTDAMRSVLATPLDGGNLTLASIPRSRRLDELEFVLPVAHTTDAFTARRLASAFAATPGGSVPTDYAERLATLRFLPLRGFLKGFVDLVFEHEGRFHVVDYKSNYLGAYFANYDAASMTDAMVHHDYFLQYHLYSVALHEWLRRRLRGYDFEKHFGGVYYLFVRGMSAREPGKGIFFDRPPRERVNAISRALGGGAA
jgi:exodeoxyribonuclease V beta subunit